MRLQDWLRERTPAIPIADAPSLRPQARRTLIIRLVLVGLLLACLLAAVAVARESSDARRTFFEARKSSVLVIDSSSSVDPARRELIGRVLRKLLGANSAFGIVFFSDSAYEAVPPNTRWTELEPLRRFFHDAPTGGPADETRGPNDPWTAFRGGTNISNGLRLARTILQRERSNAGVLLMSDLDNSVFDDPKLTQTLAEYASERIPLRVLPLEATPEDTAFFATALGRDALVTDAELAPTGGRAPSVATTTAPTPMSLVGASLVLLLLLGANEHWAARLRWQDRRSEEQP